MSSKRLYCTALVAVGCLAVGCGEPVGTVRQEFPVDDRVGLEAERVVEVPLDGRKDRYRIHLEAGELLRLSVEQYGVDVEAMLCAPPLDDATEDCLTVDTGLGSRGREQILWRAHDPGLHSLFVTSSLPAIRERPERYVLRVESIALATERDRDLAMAYRELVEASYPEDEERLLEVARTFRALEELAFEAEALTAYAGSAVKAPDRREEGTLAASRAVELFEQIGEREWEVLARRYLSSGLLDLHRSTQAVAVLERQVELALELDWRLQSVRGSGALGQAYERVGRFQEALGAYQAALEFGERESVDWSDAAHNYGHLRLHAISDPQGGLEYLEAALPGRVRQGENDEGTTLGQIGRAHLALGNYQAAFDHQKRSLELCREDDSCCLVKRNARLAEVERARGRTGSAERFALAAETWLEDEDCGDGAVGDALGQLASFYVEDDQPRRAGELLERHRVRAERVGNRLDEARAWTGLSRVRRALGQETRALAASARAVTLFQDLAPELERADLRRSFLGQAREASELRVELLVEAGETDRAFEVAEAARARIFHDHLAIQGELSKIRHEPAGDARADLLARAKDVRAEITGLDAGLIKAKDAEASVLRRRRRELLEELEEIVGRSRAMGMPGLRPRPVGLAEARNLLDEGALLLFYDVGEEDALLWAVSRESTEFHRLGSAGEISVAVPRAQTDLWRGSHPTSRRWACELSSKLLGPVAERLLRSAPTSLLVVASGRIEEVPFAALPVLAGSEACDSAPLLAQIVPISYSPSISVLAQVMATSDARERAPVSGLAYGGAIYGQQDRRCPDAPVIAGGLPEIPGSEAEAQLFCGDGECRLGAEATKETFLGEDLSRYRILDLALHAEVDVDEPQLSSIVFAQRDARCQPLEGRLHAYELSALDLAADLVILSGCGTGRGTSYRGEGHVSGLQQGFFVAGATRVLSTLWSVDDRSAQRIVAAFSSELENGLAPAEALRRAQLAEAASGTAGGSWAAFVLHGDPRPLP